jgi:diketogulonate reductase-like aldo/keto reductase
VAVEVARRFYPSVGERLSVIGLGTWAIRDYDRAFRVAARAIEEFGVNVIDTAEMYGYGAAERFVGRLLREVGRESVFVTTKLLPQRFRDPDSALQAARASLRRLNVDEADLVLIHWPDDVAPVERQIRSLEAIAEAGLARYIGVSNFEGEALQRALESTRRYEIVADQIHYSILRRQPEWDGTLAISRERGLMIQAYRVIERGSIAAYPRVNEVARALGLKPIEVAIAYVINSLPTSIALVKTENEDHLSEIVRASAVRLSEEELERVRSSI